MVHSIAGIITTKLLGACAKKRREGLSTGLFKLHYCKTGIEDSNQDGFASCFDLTGFEIALSQTWRHILLCISRGHQRAYVQLDHFHHGLHDATSFCFIGVTKQLG